MGNLTQKLSGGYTFDWLHDVEHLAKDFEISLLSAGNLIKLAHIGQIVQSFR